MNQSFPLLIYSQKLRAYADILSIRVFEYINLLTAKMDFDEISYR